MTVTVDDKGQVQTVLSVKDEGSAVVEKFAENTEKALDKAAGAASGAGDQLAGSTKKTTDKSAIDYAHLGKVIGQTAIAVGTFAAGVAIWGLKMGDELDKQSKKLGVTVEWLQKISTAAGTIDAEDKFGTWIRFMSRNLSQAAETGKGISSVVEGIGLDVTKLRESGPEKAFETIVTALERIPDPMDRTRASMAIFGRGADDVHRMGDALRDTAADFANMTKITGEAAAASNKFWDQIGLLLEHFKTIPKIVTNQVAKPFAEIADIFKNFVANSGALELAGGLIAYVLKAIGSVVVTVGLAFGTTGKIMGGFIAIMGQLAQGNLRAAIEAVKALKDDLVGSLEKFAELQKQLNKPLGLMMPDGKGGAKKMSFDAAAAIGGMMKTGFTRAPANDGTWSDVLPGAEVRTAGDEDETAKTAAHLSRLSNMRRAYHFDLLSMDAEAAADRQAIVDAAIKGELSSIAMMLGTAVGLMQSKSRTMFAIGKAAALSEAVINTYQAVSNALALKPFWVGLAMAGVAFAKGVANVQAIRATQYGGQAATPTFNASPNTGLPIAPSAANENDFSQSQVQTSAQPRFTGTERVTLVGDFFSAAWIEDKLIPLINDAQKRGVYLDVHQAAA